MFWALVIKNAIDAKDNLVALLSGVEREVEAFGKGWLSNFPILLENFPTNYRVLNFCNKHSKCAEKFVM